MPLDQNRASKPQERGGVGKDADDIGAVFDLFIDPFQRIRGPDLSPVWLQKTGEGEEVGPRVIEHRGDLRMRSGKYGGELAELFFDVFTIGLGEDGASDRRDHTLGAFRDNGKHVAHKMNSTALPTRALENSTDRFLEPGVRVIHDQLHPVDPADFQRVKKYRSEPLVFGISDVETEYLPAAGGGDSDGDDDGSGDDAVIDSGFAVGRVEEHIREIQCCQGPVPKLCHLRVQASTNVGDL